MNQISLDAKGGQFLADLANWQRESAPDNSADLERLRRNLRFARQQVLTKRDRSDFHTVIPRFQRFPAVPPRLRKFL